MFKSTTCIHHRWAVPLYIVSFCPSLHMPSTKPVSLWQWAASSHSPHGGHDGNFGVSISAHFPVKVSLLLPLNCSLKAGWGERKVLERARVRVGLLNLQVSLGRWLFKCNEQSWKLGIVWFPGQGIWLPSPQRTADYLALAVTGLLETAKLRNKTDG